MATLKIHEFSTGIEVQGNPSDWWSTGFTSYMNSTLSTIPSAVQNAISDDLFEATPPKLEGTERTIIGREVDDQGDAWSVIAVITSAQDEKGRSITVFRYFLTKGKGNLEHLVWWYMKSGYPIFNPFENEYQEDFYFYNTENSKKGKNPLEPLLQYLNPPQPKVIISFSDKFTSLQINILANHLKQPDDLAAWAYNVGGLKKPWYFQVIYPASFVAEQTLKQEIAKGVNIPALVEGESPVKTAINNLANQATIKPEHITALKFALENGTYTNNVWKNNIFVKVGINDAVNSRAYSPNFVRLYLLYGLIIQENFIEFLAWLNQLKNEEAIDVAVSFSRSLQKYFDENSYPSIQAFQDRAYAGIDYVVASLPNSSETGQYSYSRKDRTNWLATWLKDDEMGLWGKTYYTLYKDDLWDDIEQIAKNMPSLSVLNQSSWSKITQILKQLINNKDKVKQKEYKYLGNFFEKMGDSVNDQPPLNYSLSGIFYSIALGIVPIPLWKKLNFSTKERGKILKTLDHSTTITSFKKQIGLSDQIHDFWLIKRPQKQDFTLLERLIIVLLLLFIGVIIGELFKLTPLQFSKNLASNLLERFHSLSSKFAVEETQPTSNPSVKPTTSSSKPTTSSSSSNNDSTKTDKQPTTKSKNSTQKSVVKEISSDKNLISLDSQQELVSLAKKLEKDPSCNILTDKSGEIKMAIANKLYSDSYDSITIENVKKYQTDNPELGKADGVIGGKTTQQLKKDILSFTCYPR